MAYCTVDEVLARMGHAESTSTVSSSNIEAVADAVTERINEDCGRPFGFTSSTSTEVFSVPKGYTDILRLPDFQSITTLELDDDDDGAFGTTIAATDYEIDSTYRRPASDWPVYDTVRLLERYFPIGGRRRRRIRVTATWGWPSTPTPIREACIIMTARIVTRPKSPLGVHSFGEFGAASIRSVDPDYRDLIRPYVIQSVA